jgi:hypothetical protein
MAVADTPNHVRNRVASVFAAMSGAERVRCATEMADEARVIALAGIKARRAELNDGEVVVEWMRLLHGEAVAEHAARCSSSS